jgi:hypothetical protein
MTYRLLKNKNGFGVHGTIFYFLRILLKKKNIQEFEKISFDKEKFKKFNQYAKNSNLNFEKKFLKNTFLQYIEEKKKIQNYMKTIFKYISDSNSILYEILIENKKQESNFKNPNNNLFFKTGELDCFERKSKEILELDKENFYIKQNDLKVKKELNKDLTEKIKKQILNTFMNKIQFDSNQKATLLNKKNDNIHSLIEKSTNNQINNESFFEKKKERKKIIILLNHIFIKLNKFYSKKLKKRRGCSKF